MWNIIAVATSFHSNYIPHAPLLCYYLFLLNKQTKTKSEEVFASMEKKKKAFIVLI